MRLGQLARKLGTSTTEIVAFLSSKNIPIEDGINTRVDDMLVTAVVERFAPDRLSEFTAVESQPEPEVAAVPMVEEPTVVDEAVAEVPTEQMVEEPSEDLSKIEVIKAPKVELAGLKVLGKIDLPEPKKKEEPKAETDETPAAEGAAPAPQPVRTPRPPRNQNRNQQRNNREPRKNPAALQREREEQEAKRKREEELKREKDRKKQHYLKNVKVAAPTKAAKILREEVEELDPIEERPKTWWGRVKKWFTT